MSAAIKVRATAVGYYGSLREVGEEFSIAADRKEGDKVVSDFSKNWMEKVEDADDDKPAKPGKQEKKPAE